IGNPPFGHAGEGAIRDWIDNTPTALVDLNEHQCNDFRRFEGNAQTTRLVSRIQILVKDEGLNLTCGTMSALLKYSSNSSDVQNKPHSVSKPGYFQSEADIVQWFRNETGVEGSARNPITLMMEA